MARTTAIVGVGGLVAGLVLGAAGMRLASADSGEDDTASAKKTATVAVERRTLEVTEETTGELASSTERELTTIGSGTVTTEASVGAQLDRGSTIARVDDRPVVLLLGDQPAWRSFQSGMTDGADVRQLEFNLAALGFDPGGMTLDTEFDRDTAAAIEAWEESLDDPDADGVIDAGQIVFAGAPVQVTAATAAGTRVTSGASLASARPDDGAGLQLTFTVTEEADRYQVGQPVSIVTTDGDAHPATVSAFERVASTGGQPGGASSTSFTVTATPDDGTGLIAGPVTVDIPTERAENVLAVPSRALVAVVEGGQAVERKGGTLVAVDVGVFADGWVEISGTELNEGDPIVVPA